MSEQIEVKATGGVGWYFFALIPGTLAGALLMYLAFYTGVIDWQKAQRIEGRMDARVGVNGQLTAPVDLIIRPTGCLKVSRAYLDGDGEDGGSNLVAYVTNGCNSHNNVWALYWRSVAPDGTTIQSGYDNLKGDLSAGETLEVRENVPNDSRTVKVLVWAANE